jgi:ABC-type metal ion transport system substrate-binding protein
MMDGERAAEPLRIGVPGDPVNTGRALLLLQSMWLLKLRASSTT